MVKTIYILEDDQDIREIIEFLLKEENYQVYGFGNVADFMSVQTLSNANLFLLDVMLPDGNGIEVCSQLKKNPRTGHIPVLMMSAHSSQSEIERECQTQGFLAKPFDIDTLINKVYNIISS